MTSEAAPARRLGFRTRAIHAGGRPDPETGARNVPIYQSAAFVFESAADAGELFALQKYGTIYSRLANPTVAALEERVASLDGGIGAVAVASGQAATFLALSTLCGAGDHIVAAAELYGGTRTLFESLSRFGIATTFAATPDADAFAPHLTPSTRALFVEAVANPSGAIADFDSLGQLARDAGVPLIVDATLVTPYLCRPLELGADIVVHSATKFLGGHGTSLGGLVVDSGRFDWGNGRYPSMTQPVASYGGLTWWGNFGEYALGTRMRCEGLRDFGPALSPNNAFLLLQGIETLAERMDRHVVNAAAVADHLAGHPDVAWVTWSGSPDHPHHERAARYLPDGAPPVLTFGLHGGRATAERFIDAVELCSHVANVGDVRTLVIHPASTTHRQLSDDALAAAGVGAELIRVSVGLEDVADIIDDIDQAIAVANSRSDGR